MFTTIFLDIGGVILTNGWDRHCRERAAKKFDLDLVELNNRHALTFDTYEIGKISLEEYVKRVVFYEKRHFTPDEFKDFMFSQSQMFPEMIKFFGEIKRRYSFQIVGVTNEGRELMEHRIRSFGLKNLIDTFVCSAFVGLKKPDEDIYRIALDVSQVNPKEVIYIDDRPMLVEIGQKLGFQSIQHASLEQTEKKLREILQ